MKNDNYEDFLIREAVGGGQDEGTYESNFPSLDTGTERPNERSQTDGDWPELPTNPWGCEVLNKEYNRRWGAAGIKP